MIALLSFSFTVGCVKGKEEDNSVSRTARVYGDQEYIGVIYVTDQVKNRKYQW